MNEIVDEVLKAEQEAEKLVENAREQIQKKRNGLETELADRLKKARDAAQEMIQETITRAKEETQKEYSDIMMKAEAENREFLEKNASKVDKIIENIVHLIITPEYNRE
jgi:vacuolar-type H+-ATPase subunit H